MISYDKLRHQPQLFEKLTGINLTAFDKLHRRVIAAWQQNERRRLTRAGRQRAIGGGRNYSLGIREQLLMTLMWLHLELNTKALGEIFGVDKSTVSRNTRRMRTALTRLGSRKWPDPPLRGRGKNIDQVLSAHPDLQLFLDEFKRRDPVTNQAQAIDQTPPFQNLSISELGEIERAARFCRFEQRDYFYHQGDPATSFYILVEGQVRLSEVTTEGHQVLVRFANPGEAIGIIAVLKNSVYPLAAQAVQDCTALAWDSATLENLMERFPRIAINGLRLVSQRWHEVEERYRELATERVERRVAQTLLRLVRQMGRKVDGGILIDLSLTRQDLAEMTGTTQYTVSRILSRWEQESLIKTARGRILVCYPHGLTRIADDLPP